MLAPFPNFVLPMMPVNFAAQRCPTRRADAPQRILIVKLGALGDILMATPLLTALRRSYPNAHLTWLVDQANVQTIDANPFVDEVIAWGGGDWGVMRSTRPRNWVKNWFGLRWLAALLRLRLSLRRRFDIAISFHPEDTQFLLDAAAPAVSVGVFQSPGEAKIDYADRYTKAYTSRHTDAQVALDFPARQTDTYLLPLDALGLPPSDDKQMVMGYTAEDAAAAGDLLREQGIGPGFAVLAPKTTWATKCWPEEHWAKLADALAGEGHQVVLVGSGPERAAIERVASLMQSEAVVLAGRLRFRELAALIARASLCISSDSAPMHLAAAVGTPYVALFGPTPASRWSPAAGQGTVLLHLVPCGPCMRMVCPNPPENYHLCMRLLTVTEVLDASLSVLAREAAAN